MTIVMKTFGPFWSNKWFSNQDYGILYPFPRDPLLLSTIPRMRLDCSVSSLGLLIKLMKGEKLVEGLLFSSCMVGGEKWIQECECVFNGLAQFKLVCTFILLYSPICFQHFDHIIYSYLF